MLVCVIKPKSQLTGGVQLFILAARPAQTVERAALCVQLCSWLQGWPTSAPLTTSWCLLLMIARSLCCLVCWESGQDGGHKGNQAVQRQFSSECKHPLHQPFPMWFQNKTTKDTSVCYCCCLPVLNICANLQFSRQAVFLVVTCEYHVSY